jgi:DNA-binding beta-propeller fold protein YncE
VAFFIWIAIGHMKLWVLPISILLVVTACTPSDSAVEAVVDDGTDETTTTLVTQSFAGTVDAPEFPEGLDWINTAEPITLNELRGKIVLLDFWTYGCVNCIHIIPDLERLEAEYADELVVIGVHSAKFTNESDTNNLKDIVQRYGLEHPVVNDKDFAVWNQWGANAWPTIALIDPAGRAVGVRAGEGVYDAVEPIIAGLVAEFDASGAIDRRAVHFELEAETAPARPLDYPGKVLAADGRLWIADSGHNRVLEVDPATGDVLAAFGSGRRGFDDGEALASTFDAPQGLALNADADELYVADTGNHAVRVIDLITSDVGTLIGTGDLGWPPASGTLDDVALNSPWDVLYSDGVLYIANAGTHQIWAADLATELVGPLIGSAREGTANGTFAETDLAQPSGLALTEDGALYLADSESSSIRVGDLLTGLTSLVVGGDANLFDFGDQDGVGNEALLQHPLGVAWDGTTLYVADTYNSKLKRIDVEAQRVDGWLGVESGWADGAEPLFNEPGGLSYASGLLYVADTNNHAVRIVDTETGDTTTLILKGVEKFNPPSEFFGQVIALDPVSGAAGQATIVLNYRLPDGYKVNEDAPSSLAVAGGKVVLDLSDDEAGDLTRTGLPASVSVDLVEGSGDVTLDVTLIYCEAVATSLCLIDQVRYELPLNVGSPGASTQIVIERTIPTPG